MRKNFFQQVTSPSLPPNGTSETSHQHERQGSDCSRGTNSVIMLERDLSCCISQHLFT